MVDFNNFRPFFQRSTLEIRHVIQINCKIYREDRLFTSVVFLCLYVLVNDVEHWQLSHSLEFAWINKHFHVFVAVDLVGFLLFLK